MAAGIVWLGCARRLGGAQDGGKRTAECGQPCRLLLSAGSTRNQLPDRRSRTGGSALTQLLSQHCQLLPEALDTLVCHPQCSGHQPQSSTRARLDSPTKEALSRLMCQASLASSSIPGPPQHDMQKAPPSTTRPTRPGDEEVCVLGGRRWNRISSSHLPQLPCSPPVTPLQLGTRA